MRERAPSMTETFTTVPRSRTAQIVASASARAERTRRPLAVSRARMTSGRSEPGTLSPVASCWWGGRSIEVLRDVAPSDTTSVSAAVIGVRSSNRCVPWHTRHLATPRIPPFPDRVDRSSFTIRCEVTTPQIGQRMLAEPRAVAEGRSSSGSGGSAGFVSGGTRESESGVR